jgi:hypothetical protein
MAMVPFIAMWVIQKVKDRPIESPFFHDLLYISLNLKERRGSYLTYGSTAMHIYAVFIRKYSRFVS